MRRLAALVCLLGCSSSSEPPPIESPLPDVSHLCPTGIPDAGLVLPVLPKPRAIYEVADGIELSALHVVGADEVEQRELERIAERASLQLVDDAAWTLSLHPLAEGAAFVEQCELPVRATPGAHFMRADPAAKTIDIVAPELAGRFHALQTLEQVLGSSTGSATLTPFALFDAPAQAHRGVIEGFYGTPWSDEKRVAMMEALGDLKLNLFAYAPKEDASFNVQWRNPLTSEDRGRIESTLAAAEDQRIELCWEVHLGVIPPAYSNQDEADALCAKLESIAALGVSCLVVAFDDVLKVLDGADREQWDQYWQAQASFMQRVTQRLRSTVSDARLLFVPHEYWTNHDDAGTDLASLAELLRSDWEIGWTGPEIISPTITATDVDEIEQLLGVAPLLGDNYPVSDAADFDGEIYLGPLVGREAAVAHRARRIVFNPMSLARASLPALATAADWAWNPDEYDPERSAREAARLYGGPDGAAALTALSDVLRSPLLESSVAPGLQAELEAFWVGRAGKGAGALEAEALRVRFAAFAAVVEGLTHAIPELGEELSPWAAKLAAYGEAGRLALDLLSAPTPPQAQVDALRLQADSLAAEETVRPCGDLMDGFLARALEELGSAAVSGLP
ncbi:MAG: beta-N-acetylglucosaminidase domain-containing protein [Deltaproteobacteria bacterium]|jgi:hyaluronoglucosaminidase|nr:beta-N-acetylglucosaminidase domain-containing protein [Deltaproteobacteria bacterium]MBW2534628.1 beta-N-acetylglucosaminidase domain-containing protein [Deltaproteobacteria bacterium]